MRLLRAIGAVLLLLASTVALSSAGSKVLVIFEPKLQQEDYSLFFNGLRDRGYELTFRAPKEESHLVFQHDVPQFSHVIVFAPTTKSFAKDLSPQSLVHFLESDINVIFVLSTSQTPLNSLAAEFGLHLPPPGTPLISHFPERSLPPTIIPIPVPNSDLISPNINPILFSGVCHMISSNPLIVPILRAPAESFAADSETNAGGEAIVDAAEKGGEGLWAGSQMGIVTGFQTRNNARAMWVGGPQVFSDEFARMEVEKGIKSGNADFVQDISKWTFQETTVLRVDNSTHHRVGEVLPSEMYTTNDNVVYTIRISKFDSKTGNWAPYSGIADLQLEFTMLDPHVRIALPPVKGKPGVYEVTFRVPDRHGVFKFVVDYKRKGWTFLHNAVVVPVVPPRHDGYPRFLSAAWPYYAGAISTSLGFLLFSALWLGGVAEAGKKGKKE